MKARSIPKNEKIHLQRSLARDDIVPVPIKMKMFYFVLARSSSIY